MKVIVYPRDENPYQRLLYGRMERLGTTASYIGEETRSRTLNVLLLPLTLLRRRLSGFRILHLHWVFAFKLPGSSRFPRVRWLAQLWFVLTLRVVKALGIKLVWTAHNVLPHERVFWDDTRARRSLVAATDLVIAHAQATLEELRHLGASPEASCVIPPGPYTELASHPSPPRRQQRSDRSPRRFLFFGRILAYKGVEDLLAALQLLEDRHRMHVTIVGSCRDGELACRLEQSASALADSVTLRLGYVAEEELPSVLLEADVLVLPYRRITTSSSAILGLSFGLPVIVPNLPGLAELPADATIRYDGTIAGLAGALERACALSPQELERMSRAARTCADSYSWERTAAQTEAAFRRLLGDA